jgi:4'-phosphopantetheinyl transferase
VTRGRSVGIDIELIRPAVADDELIVDRHFSTLEREAYFSLPPQNRSAMFFRTWAGKEAFLKATGAGLSRPLSSFSILYRPDKTAELVADDLSPLGNQDWTFVEIEPAAHYVGSLVVAGGSPSIRLRRWLDAGPFQSDFNP